MNRYALSVVFVVFLFGKALPQENSIYERLNFSIEPRCGFVAPHHDYMAYFLEKNITSLQVNVGLSTFGTKNWHISYNYPQIGLGYYTSSLANDKVYGRMNALYLFVDRKFLPIQNRFNFGNRIAFGLSYVSKQYNMLDNPHNMVISTPINVFIQYDLIAYYRIASKLNIRINLGFTHTSNGSVREPNKGFNILTTGLGFQYSLTDERRLISVQIANDHNLTKHQLNVGLISGFKSISRFDNKLYSIIGLSGEYLYQFSSTSLVGAELTGYWDTAIENEFKLEFNSTSKKIDNICVAINPTYALVMGKISFAFQPGVYVKSSFKPYGFLTNKIGLRYQLMQNLFVSMSIKAHWLAKADFVEFGIRYNFINKTIRNEH